MIDDKNEATFIAVEEMEKITNLSQQGKTFRKNESGLSWQRFLLFFNCSYYKIIYRIAEAGANMAYEEFRAEVLSVYEDSGTESIFFNNLPNNDNKPAVHNAIYGEGVFQKVGSNQPTASIEIETSAEMGIEDTYIIKSTISTKPATEN